jgi:hypothetical protein
MRKVLQHFYQVKDRECFVTFTVACIHDHFLHMGEVRQPPKVGLRIEMSFVHSLLRIQTIRIIY